MSPSNRAIKEFHLDISQKAIRETNVERGNQAGRLALAWMFQMKMNLYCE